MAYQQHSEKRLRRQRRVRARIRGVSECPRLSVFRSQRRISAQLIDDTVGVTIAAISDREFHPTKASGPASRMARAGWVGEEIAKKAITQGIRAARFDRGRYRYHGLVAALAAGARRGGLTF